MLLDIVDALRCPAEHEESWLVTSAEAWEGRHVVTGKLGCPVCRAEYPIRQGVVDFSSGVAAAGGMTRDADGRAATAPSEEDAVAALRLAAQLDLREPGGIVVLSGRYARLVESLATLVEARYVVLNAGEPDAAGVASLIRVGAVVPLAARSLRAVAVDPAALTSVPIHGVVRTLRPGGRIAAPVALDVPAGVRELARDDVEWVGESATPAAPPVQIVRRGG